MNKDYYVQRFLEVKGGWNIDDTAAAIIVLAESIVDAASNIGYSINAQHAGKNFRCIAAFQMFVRSVAV